MPATSFVTAIILAGTAGVLLRRAWARAIAALAALLTALTGAGLVFALPALAVLWSRASRIPLDTPDVADLPEPPRAPATYRPSSLFTAATVLICVAAYIAELPGSNIGFVLIGAGPPPPVVTLGAVNAPAIASGEVWRPMTAGYLHGGLLHLLLNIVALIVVGRYVDRQYGPARSAVVYFGSLVGSNLLAAVLSSPTAYTLGASGAVMGLLAAMVRAGTRFRSEGNSLVWSAGVVLATLLYGFLHSGVSNSAHVGGLLIGFCLAAGIGTHPAWTSQLRRLEWSRRVESERERDEALRYRPLPAAIADPGNRIVLHMSAGQRVRRLALATVFPIAFVGDLVYLLTLGRPPTSAELGFAGLATMMALPSIVVVLGTFGHLELRPDGFRQVTPLLPAPLVPWLDVDGEFFTSEVGVGYQKFVAYHLTPAAQARVAGLRSLVPGATQRVMVYGMTADRQAELMEEWWRRWAGMRSAAEIQPQ